MGRSLPSSRFATHRAVLRLYDPRSGSSGSDCWKINGHPARLLIWTTEEWERLEQRPADAQFHPFGVWCALRVE
jgi:hypothetical protein